MEGADIYQIAKNCRTSVEMIEKFYASHIKNQLSAAAINVKRPAKAAGSLKLQPPQTWTGQSSAREASDQEWRISGAVSP